ncbi:MAG: hypothetical protein V3U75_10805 [Methylococcaceae bacterium]
MDQEALFVSNNREDQLSTAQVNEFRFRMAYRVAGNAVAIYLNNSQKKLPEILFHVNISEWNYKSTYDSNRHDHILEGGRLVSSQSISSTLDDLTDVETDNLLVLAEADIFSLLVGPIAVAKYISIIDNECFNVNLLTVNSLTYYGGSKNLILIDDYLKCFWRSKSEKSKKLTEIFQQAFQFVSEPERWLIIKTLAHFIFEQKKSLLDYQEIASVIEAADCLHQTEHNNLTNLWRLKNKGKV